MFENWLRLVISLLFCIVLMIGFVCFRMCCWKQKQIGNQSVQTVTARNYRQRSASTISEWTPPNYQTVCARLPPLQPTRNTFRLSTGVPVTQIVQEMEEHFRSESLQNDYERRAQERREALNRSIHSSEMPSPFHDTISYVGSERRREISRNATTDITDSKFHYTNPAPRYVSPDDELPSYEQAISPDNASASAQSK